jgi:predicted enzyme related to lactoylglutathione lyase
MRSKIGWPMWIGVVAVDLARQRDFYGRVLGLTELEAGRDWIQFSLGPDRLFEVIAQDPAAPEYRDRGYRVGFEVNDIRSATAELVGQGADAVTGVLGGPESWNRWSYFRDPEGNVFELTQRV